MRSDIQFAAEERIGEPRIPSVGKLAKALFDVCYRVDCEVAGWSADEAFDLAIANSQRHAHTLHAILQFLGERKNKEIRVLNASGLSCGHGDFSIVSYLRSHMPHIKIRWEVFDSPRNRFIGNPVFKKYLADLGISLHLSDFNTTESLYGEEQEAFDICISTEIIEHLDYSVFLRSLRSIRQAIAPGGLLILTTPNFVDWRKRILFFWGLADFFEGDGVLNMEHGVYGHTILYDITRLRRILPDCGFQVQTWRTFNHWTFSARRKPLRLLLATGLELVLKCFPGARFTLMVLARRGAVEHLPLKL